MVTLERSVSVAIQAANGEVEVAVHRRARLDVLRADESTVQIKRDLRRSVDDIVFRPDILLDDRLREDMTLGIVVGRTARVNADGPETTVRAELPAPGLVGIRALTRKDVRPAATRPRNRSIRLSTKECRSATSGCHNRS